MASLEEKPGRFAKVDDTVLSNLVSSATSKNTHKQIKYAVTILSQYAISVGHSLDIIEAFSKAELDEFLQKFYAACRKTDGSMYLKKSMQGIKFGLQRHFQALHRWDIVRDRDFAESNLVFKSVLVQLKMKGLGSVQHKNPISPNDFEKIRDCDACDPLTPRGLQNMVFINTMLFLCNRGQENLRDMQPSDFLLETDDEGIRFISRRDMFTKNNREDADEKVGGKMYELPGNPRCPVDSFLRYKAKLHPLCPAFWQKPREVAPEDPEQPWYCNSPVGNNTLSKKMKVISTSAGCATMYTNHCLRATCVTVLDREGFASRDIMTVSGHHSETSIKHYSKTSDDKMRQMSNAIARKSMSTATAVKLPTPAPLMTGPTTTSFVSARPGPEPRPIVTCAPVVPAIYKPPTPAPLMTGPITSFVSATPGPEPRPSVTRAPAVVPAIDLESMDLQPLSDSQEKVLLQDIAVSINNEMRTSSNQTFNLSGCTVHIYNNAK